MKELGDITLLQIKDLGLIEYMSLEFDKNENVLRVIGPNDSAKSTLLDSLKFALEGAAMIPNNVIRKGASDPKAVIHVETSTGYSITRKIRKTGEGVQVEELEVKLDGAPIKSAQTFLSQMASRFPDPQHIADMSGEELYRNLRLLVGDELVEVENIIQNKKAEVSVLRKQIKDLGVREAPAGNEIPLIPVAEASDRLLRINETLTIQRDRLAAARARLQGIVKSEADNTAELCAIDARLDEIAQEQERLTKRQADLKADNESYKARSIEGTQVIKKLEETLAEINEECAKAKEVFDQAKAAQETEAERTAYKNWLERKTQLDEAFAHEERNIEALTETRTRLILEHDFKVKGLSITEDAVMLDKLPWDRASTSSRLLAAVELSAASIPAGGLRVMYMHRGESLGEAKRLELARFAQEHGIKILMEVMSEQPVEQGPGIVHIVGGKIQFGADTEPAARKPVGKARKDPDPAGVIEKATTAVGEPSPIADDMELF